MEIEKLIEKLRTESLYKDKATLEIMDLCMEAATALEQLQAESDRLKREKDEAIRLLTRFAPCAGCKWYRGRSGCGHEIGCDPSRDFYEFEVREG